jgi:hypothetical protein
LTDVAVEMPQRSIAKAEHGIDFTDIATRLVLRGFAGCKAMHDRQPDQRLRFEFDPVEKVLGTDGIRILRLEIASISSVISSAWPCSYVFETALHTRLDTGSAERCDLTEMLWNLRTRAKDYRTHSRTYVRRWRVERDSRDAIDRQRHGHCSGRRRERIYLHVRMRDAHVCSHRLHRYFSSMFPRHSNAKAICIANRRIEHVRFLESDSSSIQYHSGSFTYTS